MTYTLLDNGLVRMVDAAGRMHEIGPEHPDYREALARAQATAAKPPLWQSWAMAVGFLLFGIGGVWYNWHLVATEGRYYLKLSLIAPLSAGLGAWFLYRLVMPALAGTRADKVVTGLIVVVTTVACLVNAYLLAG